MWNKSPKISKLSFESNTFPQKSVQLLFLWKTFPNWPRQNITPPGDIARSWIRFLKSSTWSCNHSWHGPHGWKKNGSCRKKKVHSSSLKDWLIGFPFIKKWRLRFFTQSYRVWVGSTQKTHHSCDPWIFEAGIRNLQWKVSLKGSAKIPLPTSWRFHGVLTHECSVREKAGHQATLPRHPSTSWKGVLGMLLGSKYLLRRCLDV